MHRDLWHNGVMVQEKHFFLTPRRHQASSWRLSFCLSVCYM